MRNHNVKTEQLWSYSRVADSRVWPTPESPGGAHHGGAQHSSDIAVSTEVLRFVYDPRTNLSNPALAILLTDF
jgi:hypothetical protein